MAEQRIRDYAEEEPWVMGRGNNVTEKVSWDTVAMQKVTKEERRAIG